MRIESVLLAVVLQALRGQSLIARVGRRRILRGGEEDGDAMCDEVVGEALNLNPVSLDSIFVPAEKRVHVLAEHVPEELLRLRTSVCGTDGVHRPPTAPVLEAEDVARPLLKAGVSECGRGGDVAADEHLVRSMVDKGDLLQVGQQQTGDWIEAQISMRRQRIVRC
jgi:hypothetical protein